MDGDGVAFVAGIGAGCFTDLLNKLLEMATTGEKSFNGKSQAAVADGDDSLPLSIKNGKRMANTQPLKKKNDKEIDINLMFNSRNIVGNVT